MPLKISIHNNISLAGLIDIHRKGGLVLKTPHVGNIYPNNLAIASLKIPTLFYDRTLGKKDLNFHPNKIIYNGVSEIISDPNILTSHSIITRVSNKSPYPLTLETSLVDFHMGALKQALPQAICFTYSEYLKKNKDRVLKILEIATNLRPDLWTRTVSKIGITSKSKAKNWSEIIKYGIYGVTNSEEGWIIPNPISILFHGTIDLQKTKVNDTYLLSGPDMYRYINGYQEELSEIYDCLRKTLVDWYLPEILNCHIIPVINMRFIVENTHKDALDELVHSYLQFVSIRETVGISFQKKLKSSETKDSIAEKNRLKQKIYDCLSKNFIPFTKTVFYDIENANCFTQYDLLKSNGLYVHPWAIDSNLEDVSKAFSFLKKCHLLVKDQLQEEI